MSNLKPKNNKQVKKNKKSEKKDLTDEELESLKEAFSLFDKNGDGKISAVELGDVMRVGGQNPTEAELNKMIREVDTNKSGFIEMDEFLKLMREKATNKESAQRELMDAFRVFDKDNDGLISAEELKNVMTKLGEKLTVQEAEDMIKAADTNGDGFINFEEFGKMMGNKF